MSTPHPSSDVHGDAELAAAARRRLGLAHLRFVVAQAREGEVHTASVGLPLDAEVEIGSVSKGLTGMLFADARARGEVGDDTRLGDLLPLGDAPASSVTLGALATHRSGLPRLSGSTSTLRATWSLLTRGTNPYGESLEELLEGARHTAVGSPRPGYSNLGFMLLGHAVAAAAGSTYAELLRTRLTEPLAMAATTVPATAADLRPAAVLGTGRGGRPREAWTGEGVGPAGGVRSTAGDLGRLVTALLDGTAPGVVALEPVADFRGPRLRIGAGWMTVTRGGVPLTWHNGGTGGFRSMVALDRGAGTGVVLVSARARTVDGAGMRLLQEAAGRPSRRRG